MLAAIPDNPRPLELVRLILSMVADDGQSIPPQLKEFLVTVITEAKAVSIDPDQVANIKYPEAIQLALEMKMVDTLASSLEQVTTFESIRPELASHMLMTMDHHPA